LQNPANQGGVLLLLRTVTIPDHRHYKLGNLNPVEPKKAPNKDLHQYRQLLSSIGSIIALSLTLVAFEWKTYSDPIADLRKVTPDSSNELVNIPITQLIPPKPAPRPMNLIETKETEPVDINIPLIDIEPKEPIQESQQNSEPEPEENPDLPIVIAEEPASPHGGIDAFYSFISRQLTGKYPAIARRMEIQGRVFVEFIVERDGKLSEVRVIKGIGGGCDELAVRAVQAAPAWKPGRQRGRPVRQKCTLPIVFMLE